MWDCGFVTITQYCWQWPSCIIIIINQDSSTAAWTGRASPCRSRTWSSSPRWRGGRSPNLLRREFLLGFSNFGINLLCDLLLLTFRVFQSQNWRIGDKMQSDLIEGVLNFCLFFLASKWLCQLHRYQEYLDGWILILIVFFRISILNFSSLSFSLSS